MKRNIKSILVLLALLPLARIHAQEGGIIYTEFNPPLSINSEYTPNEKIQLDVDGNGTTDIKYWMEDGKYITMHCSNTEEWEMTTQASYTDDYIATDISVLWSYPGWSWDISVYIDGYYHFTIWDKWFYRKQVGDHYYYGWAHVHLIDTVYNLSHIPYDLYRYTMYVDKMAYCTIPDYPLRWGQTSLTGVVENKESALVIVHPNPAKDSFTLTCEQLSEVRLYSVMGQLVATKPGNGTESLTVDVSGLPSGLYFVTAISRDGRKSVQKVVKQ